ESDLSVYFFFFFFQAEDGIRDPLVTGVQTCALPISQSRVEPACLERRAGTYSQRSARPREGPCTVDPPARIQADLGGRGGKTLGRSDLVVLPVLAPEIPGRPVRNQAGAGGSPAHRRVRGG